MNVNEKINVKIQTRDAEDGQGKYYFISSSLYPDCDRDECWKINYDFIHELIKFSEINGFEIIARDTSIKSYIDF